MKKRISFGLAIAMLTGALVGCGGSADSGSNITVYSREDGSGTRDAFVEITGVYYDDMDNTTLEAIVHDSTGKVMTAVSGDPSAIGYISLGSLNDTVKAINVDGAEPTSESILAGDYKLARPFNIATSKDAQLSELAEDFIEFIFSADGQAIVEGSGFIQVVDGESFSSSEPSGTLSIGGSTSVYPVMEKLKEAYVEYNTAITVNDILIEGVGSSGGMTGAIEGTFEIGMASRDLKDSELAELNNMTIAQDGIAMIVNTTNEIEDITINNIKEVYVGNVTSYDEIN